jgi:DNA processing protein
VISPQTLLSLLNLPDYGRTTVKASLEHLESDINTPEELASFTNFIVGKVKRAKGHSENIAKAAIHSAQSIMEDSQNAGIHVISWGSTEYPSRLETIPNPPLVLFAKGNLTSLSSEVSVALIGTREPTEYGRKSTFRIGQRLAESGATVVSGLALGCDTEGHMGCLEGNGITVAVLAHGLDKISPAQNRSLAERIIEESGCLVSEYALGEQARRHHFVERDRLQSGLSDAVIVGETGLEGGSMHTVGFCEKQGRKLACIKHPEEYAVLPSAAGNQMLINDGRAFALEKRDDLVKFLNIATVKPSPKSEQLDLSLDAK